MPTAYPAISEWKITIAELMQQQALASQACQQYGYVFTNLTGTSENDTGELGAFRTSFQRQLVFEALQREVIDLYVRHLQEILMGAMIAKAQMNQPIDGEQPGAGKIGGPIITSAPFLGIGQDWDDIGTITTGAAQNWIHSGTILMGGTAGHAVKIGTNQVTVLIGMGSFHPSPKIQNVQFTIDGKPRPILILHNIRKSSLLADAIPIKEFDNAYILKKATTILGTIMVSSGMGVTVLDLPFLVGATFIQEATLRNQLATSIVGSTPDFILTT